MIRLRSREMSENFGFEMIGNMYEFMPKSNKCLFYFYAILYNRIITKNVVQILSEN